MRWIGGLAALIVVLAACATPGGSPAGTSSGASARVATSAGAANLPSGWATFTAPDGSFSVGLPSEPTAATQTTTVGGQPVDLHSFAAKAADQKTTYAISYADFPASSGSPDPNVVLDNAVHGAVTGADATLQQSHAIDLSGVPGRDWTATASGGPGHGRIYLSGTRLYQIIVAGSDAGLPNADEFLTSFAIH